MPTVTAQDYKRRGPGSRQQGLPEIIHGMLLPTPVATEIHHAERVRKWKSMNLSSPHAQIAGEKNPNGLTDFLDFYGILPEPIPDNTELPKNLRPAAKRLHPAKRSAVPFIFRRCWEIGRAHV